jgi:AP-1-like factor
VSELEKTSESTTHENGLLRAQVNTLQSELRDYRKRLSMQSSLGASPRSAGLQSFSTSSDAPVNPFQFDFTQTPYVPYGPLFPNTTIHSSPRSTMLDYKSSEGGYVSRHGSTDATSPRSNIINTPGSTEGNRSQHGSISHDSPNGTVNSPPTDVQAKLRPSSLAHVASDSSSTYNIFTSGNMTESPKPTATSNESTGAPTRIFQFNSGSSASPSTSSGSQYGGNGTSSSCGTSPEPSSGVNKEATGVLDTIDETSKQREFLDSLGQACGDVINPEPRAKSMSSSAMSSGMSMDTLTANSNPFQVFGGGQDLFSASWPDFPESNTAIQGDGSFTGGFLNDGPSIFELSSPMNWNDLTGSMRTGLTPAQQKANPFEAPNVLPPVKEEEVVPGEGQMLSCNKVW